MAPPLGHPVYVIDPTVLLDFSYLIIGHEVIAESTVVGKGNTYVPVIPVATVLAPLDGVPVSPTLFPQLTTI